MNGKVAFIGAGRWALALAGHLHRQGCTVALWEGDSTNLERLSSTRQHPDLPDNFKLPEEVAVSGDSGLVLSDAGLAVFAVPSDALDAVAAGLGGILAGQSTIVTVTKGIDPVTYKRMSAVLKARLPGRRVVVLAGPGIPYDFAAGDPTSLVAASEHEPSTVLVRDTFTGANLRVYSHPDVVGVELAAAMKNVIALAAGIIDGMGLGINAKAALLSRGLAETIRLGLAFNANPLTFAGLAGMGDLIVTAFSDHSRNHALGVMLGRGEKLESAQARLNGVAEGLGSTRTARALAARQRVELPITDELYRVLYEGADPHDGIERLLSRRPKPEVW